MTAAIVRADARNLPLPDASVDLIVTSPPYFALRDYRDGDGSLAGQIGAEASPREYVAALLECTREWMRVLKPCGSLWVNLSDKYSNGDRYDDEFTIEDAAWLGGVIDSDGSISVHINKQPEGRAPSFVPWVRVGQMRREVVDRIGQLTGTGKVWQDGRGVWNWNASAQQARWILERIWPWLFIKRKQALAAVELARHIADRKRKGSWAPLTAEDIRYRQMIREAVLAWNAGERVEWEPPYIPLPDLPFQPRRIPHKSLMLLPQRYALGCMDELGLILRAEIIWSKCLSGGTQVYARTKGRVQTIKLHDLCRHYQPEDVELWTGQKWSRVRASEMTERGEAQHELELRSGERIGCTPEHRWPTQRGLLQTADLRVGDVLETCQTPEGDVTPASLDDELVGWFVGLYIAEGSRSERMIQIAGHVNELERFKRLQALAAAFHATCSVYATHGNAATINLSGRFLEAILETYVGGRTAKDKYLGPKCWQRSNRFLRAVLDGYLAGDGHWREDAHRWVLGFTANDALAADLRALGARLGVSVRLKRTTHTGFGKQWPGWMGNITEPQRRRQPDSEIVAIRASRARQFWDLAIEDEPHLFALASGVLTHNSNGLPESVTDRVRRSHEQFFHFTKEPRYYSAVDEIRLPHTDLSAHALSRRGRTDARMAAASAGQTSAINPLGKLPGSVWEVATQPLKVPAHLAVEHFAAFPPALIRRIILGWSPPGICIACGEGRRPVATRDAVDPAIIARRSKRNVKDRPRGDAQPDLAAGSLLRVNLTAGESPAHRITGYACACPTPDAPTRPALVVDPFGGTGTSAVVASVHGRRGISFDLSADYCRLAAWRTTDPGERARALGVPKPPPVITGQGDLFGEPA